MLFHDELARVRRGPPVHVPQFVARHVLAQEMKASVPSMVVSDCGPSTERARLAAISGKRTARGRT